uniref:Serine-threonine/tyrosine-protein kinase catalytic domain-containing protein n=2 Tax=Aegilops tauschii subsp. strangulata TaxID=200361 RepID=A0A453EFQ3_AEGTS
MEHCNYPFYFIGLQNISRAQCCYFVPSNFTNLTLRCRGYMALEYLHGGTVTAKSDILSLGVIILEVITGHKDYPDVTRTSSERFVELTLDKWRSRNPLNKSPGYIPKIRRCIEIGLACVNPERKGRPSTGELIKLLQGRMTLDEV